MSLITDVNTCMSQYGHIIIGMFTIANENYEEIKMYLKEIFEQVEEIGNHIQVDDRPCKLEFYFVLS